jgi:hypothetical protein
MCYRIADKHFMDTAQKFMKDVQNNMGVHVFMLIRYKNEDGHMVKSKYDKPPSFSTHM